MNRRRDRIIRYYVFFSFLIIMGVVFSILQANLQINGTTKIANNTWDIHFDNIVVNPNSVSIGTGDTAATIDPNNDCKVDFSVTLSLPGDFYEFTVDVENDGTIDAMIGTLTKTLKVNGETVSEIPEYLIYTVTYDDGMEILDNHLLAKNTSETYKVKVEYKKDINQLPEGATLSMSLEPLFVQADSGAVAKPSSLYTIISDGAVMDNTTSTYVTNTSGINFNDVSSDTNGKGVYIRAGTENDPYPILYYRGDVDNNNLLFANFCWKIVRTTDTGGVKLIYNGLPTGEDHNECNNTGLDSQLETNSAFNDAGPPASAGYMYGNTYPTSSGSNSGWVYAPDVIYENGNYTLTSKTIDGITYNIKSSSISSSEVNNFYHHYTCGSSETTCSDVRYIYYSGGNRSYMYYVILSNGKKVEDVIPETITNSTNENDSKVKTVIDEWYSTNMVDYTNLLEDTIWCNDRAFSNIGGWNPDGGSLNGMFAFNPQLRISRHELSFECERKIDSFTVNESDVGNGDLTYPVGLITSDEVRFAGYAANIDASSVYLNNGQPYWTGSPCWFLSYVYGFYVNGGYLYSSYSVSAAQGVRPSVSLQHKVGVFEGDGTSENPYVVG